MTDIKCPWHLNYNKKLPEMLGQQMGPNVFNEMFTVAEQSYDPATNRTRLGLILSTYYDKIKAVK